MAKCTQQTALSTLSPQPHLESCFVVLGLCCTALQLLSHAQVVLPQLQQLYLLLQARLVQLLCVQDSRATQHPHLANRPKAALAAHNKQAVCHIGDSVQSALRGLLSWRT